MSRAMQSLLFSLIYSIYLVVVMGPVQWLAIRPLCALMPARRSRIVRGWLLSQARLVLGLARSVGGMRLEVQGALPETSAVVVMNHQSLLDIPIAVSLVRGPYPLIPMRASYARGIPGISGLVRIAGHPMLAQDERATRAEHRALVEAAEAVARGERSLVLFPEGHRSRDGELQSFMLPGLRLILRRAGGRPVHLVVVDGPWRIRTFADIALRLAGTRVRVSVRGPFPPPADPREHGTFIAGLHAEMETMLRGLREPDARPTPAHTLDARARLAG